MKACTWLVTGCSSGLGLALVKELLNQEYNVIATTRQKSKLDILLGNENEKLLSVQLNINNEKEIKQIISLGKEKFGNIDVLVNNAGYLPVGVVEELSDKNVKECFDVNFFGALNMIRNILPVMRNQSGGHIINISSINQYGGIPTGSTYCATKHALSALSESLYVEVSQFGIHVSNFILGKFKTNLFQNDSFIINKNTDSPYTQMMNIAERYYNSQDNGQMGDPQKAAEIIIKIAELENPPLNIPLGSDAYEYLIKYLLQQLKNVERFKDISGFTDNNN